MSREFDFIDWICGQQGRSDSIPIGIGDDLAALRWQADDLLLIGVDQVLDGVHFDSTIHTPRVIGEKVMNRNLSDCAAMAALPAAAVVSVALPRGIGDEYARELFLGMKSAGAKFDCPIVGGDTASWPGKLVATVTVLGRSAGITPISRGNARPGDQIYVTGPLGGSILGRHMSFQPRVREARQLAGTGQITSMIDISDGLSRDLRQICRASGVGAALQSSLVPIHEDAIRLTAQLAGLSEASRSNAENTPLNHALHDGEDYQLLFTASAPLPGFPFAIRIGEITASGEIQLDGRPLRAQGWEHVL